MADIVHKQLRSLVSSSYELSKTGWLAGLRETMRRQRQRKLEDFLRLYPEGQTKNLSAYAFNARRADNGAQTYGGGLL